MPMHMLTYLCDLLKVDVSQKFIYIVFGLIVLVVHPCLRTGSCVCLLLEHNFQILMFLFNNIERYLLKLDIANNFFTFALVMGSLCKFKVTIINFLALSMSLLLQWLSENFKQLCNPKRILQLLKFSSITLLYKDSTLRLIKISILHLTTMTQCINNN